MAKTKSTSKAKKKLGGPRVDGDGPRQAKVDQVQQVREKMSDAAAVVLTEYRGMTVSELAELRSGLREAGAEYRVYKNTLARIAVREAGPEGLEGLFEGPTAFTFANGDPVVAAKKLAEFAKKVPALVLKGGVLEGKLLSSEQVNALASLDSREVMLSKTAGMFVAKIQQAANLFAAGFNQLGAVLVQLRDKLPPDGSTPDVAAAPSESAEEAPEQPGGVAEAPAAEAPAPASTEEAPAESGSNDQTES